MRPSHFAPTKLLGRLNLAAVALSLAGVTTAMISLFLPGLVALLLACRRSPSGRCGA